MTSCLKQKMLLNKHIYIKFKCKFEIQTYCMHVQIKSWTDPIIEKYMLLGYCVYTQPIGMLHAHSQHIYIYIYISHTTKPKWTNSSKWLPFLYPLHGVGYGKVTCQDAVTSDHIMPSSYKAIALLWQRTYINQSVCALPLQLCSFLTGYDLTFFPP